ncbi:MAG: hypothetical protein K2G60_06215 [Oscillospiraceae bacterium]|nr:hypothetical protein [Oscillospiraceae bacterium]
MDKRLDIFLKSVTDYAQTQCKKLERTAEAQLQKEITAYKKQAVENSRSNTSREIGKIQSDAALRAAEYESEKRLALASLRNELSDGIFDEITLRIKDFTDSSEYSDFLKKSAERLATVIGSEIIFYVRPCDVIYAGLLNEIAENAEIREDGQIILGGIIATDNNNTLRADDTLDSRLSAEKKSFFENTDFKIF